MQLFISAAAKNSLLGLHVVGDLGQGLEPRHEVDQLGEFLEKKDFLLPYLALTLVRS